MSNRTQILTIRCNEAQKYALEQEANKLEISLSELCRKKLFETSFFDNEFEETEYFKHLKESDNALHEEALNQNFIDTKNEQFMTSSEVCTLLNISKTTLARKRENHQIDFIRIGGTQKCHYRYPSYSVYNLLNSNYSVSNNNIIDVYDASKILNCNTNSILYMIKIGKIPATKIGRNYKIQKKDLYEMLEKDKTVTSNFSIMVVLLEKLNERGIISKKQMNQIILKAKELKSQ